MLSQDLTDHPQLAFSSPDNHHAQFKKTFFMAFKKYFFLRFHLEPHPVGHRVVRSVGSQISDGGKFRGQYIHLFASIGHLLQVYIPHQVPGAAPAQFPRKNTDKSPPSKC
jgi:hypothetical protein